MTSICPGHIPKSCWPLFTAMDMLATRWQAVAPPHCFLALLDLHRLQSLIEQTESLGFLTSLLSPAEIELFQRFRYAKRRVEWLGGRLAAKHCLHGLLHRQTADLFLYGDYSLLPDASGRPRLEKPLPPYPAASISISHSRGYAAALIRKAGDCGIDIQQKTPKLASVQKRFATDKEMQTLAAIPDHLTRLGLLWAAKEAVKKCLLADHPSFFGAIELVAIDYDPTDAIWTARCQLTQPAAMSATVRIAELDEYLVACTARGPHA